ncbi:MAG: endonuclease domain-containing protein [Thermodesulfobacteriota bacterium]
MKRKNIEKCRRLRRDQTEAEKKLWSMLRDRQVDGVKFRRQFSIGNYMVDFYAPQYGLGIEADGGQHYTDRGKENDERRAVELFKSGVGLLRFSDHEILTNIEGVYEVIEKALGKKRDTPSPPSSPPRVEEARNRKR